MTDPFGTTHYDRTGQTRIRIKEESEMSDYLDHAAAIVGGCCAHCDDLVDERLALLDEAGLLVSPERDEERAVGSPAVAEPPVSREDVEAVLKLAYKGTSDMDREPNWLGRVRRWARDGAPFPTVESTPEPASPERDAAAAAKALREVAEIFDGDCIDLWEELKWTSDAPKGWSDGSVADAIEATSLFGPWLTARADRIEREVGESDA